MFTGIVTAKGRVEAIIGSDVRRVEISSPYDAAGIELLDYLLETGCLYVE